MQSALVDTAERSARWAASLFEAGERRNRESRAMHALKKVSSSRQEGSGVCGPASRAHACFSFSLATEMGCRTHAEFDRARRRASVVGTSLFSAFRSLTFGSGGLPLTVTLVFPRHQACLCAAPIPRFFSALGLSLYPFRPARGDPCFLRGTLAVLSPLLEPDTRLFRLDRFPPSCQHCSHTWLPFPRPRLGWLAPPVALCCHLP